jgi:hypothetical protein
VKTIVSKAKFAEMKGRVPSAVSNWIAEGKITAAALIGSGIRAQIWVEQAEADLKRTLDPAQQAAQELPANMPGPGIAPPPDAPLSPSRVLSQEDDENLRRKRKADADKAEEDARAALRRNNVEAGRWVDAAEQAREFAAQLAKLNADVETFLASSLARTVAEAHGLDWKALSIEMRDLYRNFRLSTADQAKAQREEREAASSFAEAAE